MSILAFDRAAVLGALVAGRTLRYAYAGLDFVLTRGSVNGASVTVTVAVSDARGSLPVDNPYIFVNPPTLVPNGLGGFRLDPPAALKEIVYQAVVFVAARQGWSP